MLCSPMFYIDYPPQNSFLNWVQNPVVCAIGKQSRLEWIQEGNHYDAIATQSIGPDSLYRLGVKGVGYILLIIFIYPAMVCLLP